MIHNGLYPWIAQLFGKLRSELARSRPPRWPRSSLADYRSRGNRIIREGENDKSASNRRNSALLNNHLQPVGLSDFPDNVMRESSLMMRFGLPCRATNRMALALTGEGSAPRRRGISIPEPDADPALSRLAPLIRPNHAADCFGVLTLAAH